MSSDTTATVNLNLTNQIETGESLFDGTLGSWIGVNIIGFLISLLTLGLGAPWTISKIYGWKINHTIIHGRRLKFTGTGWGLFGTWIKWLLLCIITAGIYSFWVMIDLEKWKVKNTTYAK